MSNEIVKPTNNANALSILSVEGKISKEDITKIGVAKLEQRLVAAEKAALAAIKENEEKLKKAQKNFVKVCRDQADADLKNFLGTVSGAFAGVIPDVKKDKVIHIVNVAYINVENKGDCLRVNLVLDMSEHHCPFIPVLKAGAIAKKAKKELDSLTKEGEAARENLGIIRAKMSQMGRLERQLAAKLAEAELQTTDRGAQLVDLIETSTDEFLKDL